MTDLIDADMGRSAIPAGQLAKIGIEVELKPMLVADALADGAGCPEHFADIGKPDVDAPIAQPLALAAPVAGELIAGPQVVRGRRFGRRLELQIGRSGRRGR